MQRVISSEMSSGASSISEENLDVNLEISEHLKRLLKEQFFSDFRARDVRLLEQALLYLERNKETIIDFLKQFPEQRKELESCIKCLEEMVNNNEVHKNCNKISIAANTVSLASGICNLVNRHSRLSRGVEIVADVANICRVLYKGCNNVKVKNKIGELQQKYENSLKYLKTSNEDDCELEHCQTEAVFNQDDLISVGGSAYGLCSNIRKLRESTQKANPSTEGSSITKTNRQSKEMKSDFTETSPAASKVTQAINAGIATSALICKAYVIKEDFMHLTESGEGEAEAEIRKIAENLKMKLEAIRLLHTLFVEYLDMANFCV